MKIHEYQAKELFNKFGIPIPNGRDAFNSHGQGLKYLHHPVISP